MDHRMISDIRAISDERMKLDCTWNNPRFPGQQLNEENIIMYFCDPANPFYDSMSDNETIKMQNQMVPLNWFQIQDRLKMMNGIQYVLYIASPPLFVIQKYKRAGPTSFTPLCYYYVIDGTVYQCPDVYSVVQSRLIGMMDPLHKALESAFDFLRFNPTKGYNWEFKTPPAKRSETAEDVGKLSNSEATADENNPLNVRATAYQRRTDMLLRSLVEQLPRIIENKE